MQIRVGQDLNKCITFGLDTRKNSKCYLVIRSAQTTNDNVKLKVTQLILMVPQKKMVKCKMQTNTGDFLVKRWEDWSSWMTQKYWNTWRYGIPLSQHGNSAHLPVSLSHCTEQRDNPSPVRLRHCCSLFQKQSAHFKLSTSSCSSQCWECTNTSSVQKGMSILKRKSIDFNKSSPSILYYSNQICFSELSEPTRFSGFKALLSNGFLILVTRQLLCRTLALCPPGPVGLFVCWALQFLFTFPWHPVYPQLSPL